MRMPAPVDASRQAFGRAHIDDRTVAGFESPAPRRAPTVGIVRCRCHAARVTNGGGYADINGLRMYYETHGEGPALLLLHGGTCAIDPTEVALFSDTFRVIAPEQMGHGRTADAPDRLFHYHDMAEDTIELMRQLTIDAAFVFGFSDGGLSVSTWQSITRIGCQGLLSQAPTSA